MSGFIVRWYYPILVVCEAINLKTFKVFYGPQTSAALGWFNGIILIKVIKNQQIINDARTFANLIIIY
jgi:hypothetical protein